MKSQTIVDVRTGARTYTEGDPLPMEVRRKRMSCTAYQMRLALHRMGQLAAVQNVIDADAEASIAWEYATVIKRASGPIVAALADGGFPDADIDDMFAQAMGIEE